MIKIINVCFHIMFAVSILSQVLSCRNSLGHSIAENVKNNISYIRVSTILKNMDSSVNQCNDFYSFACGGYVKNVIINEGKVKKSPSLDRYIEMNENMKQILESENDYLNGVDISIARKLYKNCLDFPTSNGTVEQIVMNLVKDLQIKFQLNSTEGIVNQVHLIDIIHRFRTMGLNVKFFLGLYVTPRSVHDNRNILEIRRPILSKDLLLFNVTEDKKKFADLYIRLIIGKKENLQIVKAGTYFAFFEGTFALQKYINGILLPGQTLSPEDEIRVDHEYILDFIHFLKKVSGKELEIILENYLRHEVTKYLPNSNIYDSSENSESVRKQKCLNIISSYETNFETAFMKTYFNEDDKNFMTSMVLNIERTLTTMISESPYLDETTKNITYERLKSLQKFIGYGENLMNLTHEDWFNNNHEGYIKNMLKLSKKQMDAKFLQLDKKKDVRDWDQDTRPSTYNPAYYRQAHSLYLPAAFVYANMIDRNLPSYMNYGSIGMVIAHEIGHMLHFTIDEFTSRDGTYKNPSWENLMRCERCLREMFQKYKLGYNKSSDEEDFADLIGFKIAYRSLVQWEKDHGQEPLLPGLEYSARQMFWISGANRWCSKESSNMGDDEHSPDNIRILLALSNLPEFSRDFDCSVGSGMNPETKCNFL